jgi:hypothetical protein
MKLVKVLPAFSYIFHPIFVSLYGTLFYFLIDQNFTYELTTIYLTLIQVSILTVFLPLALFFLLISVGIVKSFTEATIKERRLPIAIQALLLFILLKFSVSLDYIPELYFYFLGGLISALLALVATLIKHKASLHMIGISALTTFIYFLCVHFELAFVNTLALSIVCMGLVGSSRLYMKSHTPLELVTGSIIGIVPQLLLWYIWL